MYSVMSSANSESFTSSFPVLIPFMLLHLILNVYNYLVAFLGKKKTHTNPSVSSIVLSVTGGQGIHAFYFS